MLQTTMAKLSGIIAFGRLKLAAFRYWLTRKRRWNAIGENPLCTSFCPMCKYGRRLREYIKETGGTVMNWYQFCDKLITTIGTQEGGFEHQCIVKEYNKIKPLPRNYKASLKDPWCAIYASAVWHQWGEGWFPYECSCGKMVELAKAAGKFWSAGATNGHEGWLMFYDWERDGSPDHVGYIIDVDIKLGQIRTIEGNYSNQVKERHIPLADYRIYGFVELQYEDSEIDKAKEWATKNRIILGDGTADSWTKPVTREQLAVILARYHQAT